MAQAPFFRFKQGDHCCVFYEDESALVDLLVPYFAEGLQKRERCFTAQTKLMAERLKAGLAARGVAVDDEIARGALTVATLEEFYGSHASRFDPHGLVETLKEFVADSVRMGFTGIRTSGEMQFVLNNAIECRDLLEYERLVNETFPGRPVHGLCQYDTRLFDAATLEQVITLHQQSVSNSSGHGRHASMAVRRGRYVLDIVTDRRNPDRQFYYVVQEHGQRDIVAWGVEPTFEAATREAEDVVNSLRTLDRSYGTA